MITYSHKVQYTVIIIIHSRGPSGNTETGDRSDRNTPGETHVSKGNNKNRKRLFPVSRRVILTQLNNKMVYVMTESKGINFDHVSSVALDMLSSGVKPTVRGVLKVTGGKTETVSGLLRDFFDKRDAEVSKMADELGSGAIASLLANEIQVVVDRKTKALAEIVERQKEQIAEMIELLDEKEGDCVHRIELAQAQSIQVINESNEKVKVATARIETAESAQLFAQQELSKVNTETKNEIETVKNDSEVLVNAAEQKTTVLVDSAKSEAEALVNAANKQIDKAVSETKTLRQQVKEFTIDQAKHEIEQAQFEQTRTNINQLQIEIAEQKTLIVQLQTERNAFVKDTERLERDLVDTKDKAEKLSQAQTQLVELQKQLSQSQHELSQSQRERDSLSQALAVSK